MRKARDGQIKQQSSIMLVINVEARIGIQFSLTPPPIASCPLSILEKWHPLSWCFLHSPTSHTQSYELGIGFCLLLRGPHFSRYNLNLNKITEWYVNTSQEDTIYFLVDTCTAKVSERLFYLLSKIKVET